MTAQEAVRRAADKKTIIPAFNIPYLPMLKPVVEAIREEDSMAMIQVARLEWIKFEAKSLVAVAEEYGKYADPARTLLHLDHVPVIDEDGERVDVLPIMA
ncbi:MAG: class II fructose-bisphosphate aldolase, partial [Clostridiales bacterium]|nr:class II fructose-bisphosphate aldolase [Clostridiales bacterium]